MGNYICKKAFSIERYDDDGVATEDNIDVEKGQRFQVSASKYRFVGGPDTVRLESNDGTWVEILSDTLEKHFEEAT